MYYLLFAIGATALVATTWARGARATLALSAAFALATPVWMYRDFGAVRLDLRAALAIFGLLCVAFDPRTRWSLRFLWADAVVVLLAIAVIIAEALSTEVTATVICFQLVQWLTPYTLGRWLMSEPDGWRVALPAMAVVCLVLAGWSVFESTTRINPGHLITGHEGSAQGNSDIRWGLKRAEGSVTHPIFYGLFLVMLAPWALAAWQAAGQGEGPPWWRALPWILVAGIACTMSRGPQLAIPLSAAFYAWLRMPRWRFGLGLLGGLLLLGGAIGRESLVDLLHVWSGESAHETIEIHGQTYAYSGTLHRTLQVIVYGEALAHVGWFGYGSAPMAAGITQIPYVEDHLRQMFSSIDNHYLQFMLQTGILGIGLFIALGLCGIVAGARMAEDDNRPESMFSALLSAITLTMMLLIYTVWFASDYGFVWLFNVGLATGGTLGLRRSRAPVVTSLARLRGDRRLTPGHLTWQPS